MTLGDVFLDKSLGLSVTALLDVRTNLVLTLLSNIIFLYVPFVVNITLPFVEIVHHSDRFRN